MLLTTGNTADITVARDLLSQIDFKGSRILADRAYGKWEFREYIANHGADFCIPPKANNTDPWYVDWWLYKERHLVEKFFLKLKEYRRVAMYSFGPSFRPMQSSVWVRTIPTAIRQRKPGPVWGM